MRVSVALALCCLCTLSFAADPAHASIRKDLNVPAEELGSALQTVAKDYDFQVLYRTEIVKDLRTQGAVGSLTSDEALGKVLKGTGLTYKYLDSNTVTIMPAPSGAAAAAADQSPSDSSNGGGKKSSQDFRVAQVDQGKGSQSSAVGNQANSQESSNGPSIGLSEIIVTAQKKSERLQDVPVPVTVVNADALAENNQPRLQDYFDTIPGLSFSPGVLATSNIAFRGISEFGVGGPGPTVAVTVDDLPFSGTVAIIPQVVPDLDPSDLARVEALRGPQGTLYGASSLGGLLKYVTVDPSTEAVSGRVQADVNSVYNASDPGYSFRGAVNVPLNDTMAIRASAFTREDPGYIDNPVLGLKGINSDRANGGRLSALWRPSETFSLKLSALYEDTKADGNNDVQPSLGDLEQNYYRGCCGYDKKLQAYSANVKAQLGIVDLTAISGYIVNKFTESYDYSYLLGGAAAGLFPVAGVDGAGDVGNGNMERYSQELRASIPIGSHVEWLVGGVYSHESSTFSLYIPALDRTTGDIAGTLAFATSATKYIEEAAYTDLTVHFTDRFDVQFGGRESHIQQISEPGATTGALYGNAVIGAPEYQFTANPVTYLLTPEFKFTSNLMAYARIASGYRPGAFNGDALQNPSVPRAASPDKTQNYEIGFKADVLDHKLSIDASLYRIDWKNIQLSVLDPTTSNFYTANGSNAKSEGLELSVETRPLSGLTVSTWVAFDDAKLTESFPPGSSLYGAPGDRLPLASRFSGNFSVTQTFPLGANVTGFAGGQLSYLGDRTGLFLPPGPDGGAQPRQDYPPYAKLNLHAGLNIQSWIVNLYANNVTDRRGVIGGGVGDLPPTNPPTFRYIPPRVVGLSVTKNF